MSPPTSASEDANQKIMQATEKLVERITPWLLEVGSWIFGGLIGFNLIIIEALMTIGPVDAAVMVAITAFALVLPLDVAGLVLLRLVRDLEHVNIELDFENEVRQALQSADPSQGEELAAPKPLETVRKRRTQLALMYSFSILGLSIVLTLVGMIAALWHMAWWTALAFAVMTLISLGIVSIAVASSQPRVSPQEKARRRRYGQEVARQARERSGQTGERYRKNTEHP